MRATNSRAMLRDMLGADIQADKHVAVPKQFADDFELVAAHYNLKALGQYDQAKAAARADIESAIPCFAALAKEITNEA